MLITEDLMHAYDGCSIVRAGNHVKYFIAVPQNDANMEETRQKCIFL